MVATLNTENALLKEELKKKQAGNADGASVNKPSLLIGDSLVRDIHSDEQSKLIYTKYGFDILIISGSYGEHRRHTTYDGHRTTDAGHRHGYGLSSTQVS